MRYTQSTSGIGKPEIGKKRLAGFAGRVVLAAIVHSSAISRSDKLTHDIDDDDEWNTTNQHEDAKQTHRSGKRCSRELMKDACQNEKGKSIKSRSSSLSQQRVGETANTHVDLSLRKFSKLFSKKKKSHQHEAAQHVEEKKETTTSTLIDNDEFSSGGKIIAPRCDGERGEGEKEKESNLNNDREQVIEFKFDLIVDQDEEEKKKVKKQSGADAAPEDENDKHQHKKAQDKRNNLLLSDSSSSSSSSSSSASSSKRGNFIALSEMECKLNDNVNELVKSFVLDSNDVCFMSVGRERVVDLNIGYQMSICEQVKNEHSKRKVESGKVDEQFDYVSEMAAHTLAYSFHLLNLKEGASQVLKKDNHFDYDQSVPSTNAKALNVCDHPQVAHCNSQCTAKRISSNNNNNLQQEKDLDKLANNNNYYSIELSATLFSGRENSSQSNDADDDEEDSPNDELFSIVDLLGWDEDDCKCDYEEGEEEKEKKKKQGNMRANDNDRVIDLVEGVNDKGISGSVCDQVGQWVEQQQQQQQQQQQRQKRVAGKLIAANPIQEATSVDCVDVEQALVSIKRIRSKLARLSARTTNRSDRNLLIFGLKLKQRINGGLFSNRMCLIDFDPKFVEFHPIFEAIFNGQALSYLKRKRSSLLRSSHERDDDELSRASNKQHHQVASAMKLMQAAEWLLYKQLSSALIGTLIVVHVHKLSLVEQATREQVGGGEKKDSKTVESRLTEDSERVMLDNLLLLEFARSIQRASALRLKRRKRHLKSHLAASNMNVATRSNLSLAHTTNGEPLSSPTTLLPADPHRTLRRNSRSSRVGAGAVDYTSGSLNARKASMDMSLALARHHYRHRHRHHYHHEYSDDRKELRKKCSGADFTESSSMSTSSGSQTCRGGQMQLGANNLYSSDDQRNNHSSSNSPATQRQHRTCGCYPIEHRDHFSNNLSDDSDSVTSAVFNNSYSSTSQHNRVHLGSQLSPSSLATCQRHLSSCSPRKDADLKWMKQSKQSASTLNNGRYTRRDSRDDLEKPVELKSSSPIIELGAMKCSTSRKRMFASNKKLAPANVIQIDCCRPSSLNATCATSGKQVEGSCDVISQRGMGNCLSGFLEQQRILMQDDSSSASVRYDEGVEEASLSSLSMNHHHHHERFTCDDHASSDICPVVTEPPKQLKLEEFLNQLSSIITPMTKMSAAVATGVGVGVGVREDNLSTCQHREEGENDGTGKAVLNYGSMNQLNANNNNYQSSNSAVGTVRRICSGTQERGNSIGKHEKGDSNSHHNTTESLTQQQHCKSIGGSQVIHRQNGKFKDNEARQVQNSAEVCNGGGRLEVPDLEDDEDCKSHSSILEHLSSLALESNTKLNKRQQQQQSQVNCNNGNSHSNSSSLANTEQMSDELDFATFYPSGLQHNSNSIVLPSSRLLLSDPAVNLLSPGCNAEGVDTDSEEDSNGNIICRSMVTGHLQQLLNNSSQLRKRGASKARVSVKDPSNVEEKLRALSIDCQATCNNSPPSFSSAKTLNSSSNDSSYCSSSFSAAAAATTTTCTHLLHSNILDGNMNNGFNNL